VSRAVTTPSMHGHLLYRPALQAFDMLTGINALLLEKSAVRSSISCIETKSSDHDFRVSVPRIISRWLLAGKIGAPAAIAGQVRRLDFGDHLPALTRTNSHSSFSDSR